MRELIAEHKPHIDKMNKTGPQLLELSPVEGQRILETYSTAEQLYSQLKADVGQRAAALDEAISKSTQVTTLPGSNILWFLFSQQAVLLSFFALLCVPLTVV